ncbi:MAG: universal stress protein [Kofleriaceae bacterium]|nr:universal stress protein [Kofleriaceae bacterium]
MSSQSTQVVVAFDLSQSSNAALHRALTLAARSPAHILHILYVVEPHGRGIPQLPLHGAATYEYAEQVQRELATVIEWELKGMAPTADIHYFVHVRIGKPADQILGLASEIGADAIIIGTKGLTGVERLVLGSVAEHVVREAGCTVEVAREKSYGHVPLLEMTENPHHPHYVAPHRYSYTDRRVEQRPVAWPLY